MRCLLTMRHKKSAKKCSKKKQMQTGVKPNCERGVVMTTMLDPTDERVPVTRQLSRGLVR